MSRPDRAVILSAPRDGRYLWSARVVEGSIQKYYPSPLATLRRPTAKWAARGARRWIETEAQSIAADQRRTAKARRLTGYDS